MRALITPHVARSRQKRIFDAFKAEGADAWFADGAAARFLDGLVDDASQWEQVRDILDVWFDSAPRMPSCWKCAKT